MHCLGFKRSSQKKTFSLPTVLCLTHHHIIGLHVSLSSREVKTTRPDFYDAIYTTTTFFISLSFFSLYFSLSLSLFLFVCSGKRTDSIFGSFFNTCDTMIEFWSEDCCTLLRFITSRNDLTTRTFLSRRNERSPFVRDPPPQKERIKERWPRNAKPPS